jgi:hypothetical protein
MRNLLDTKVAEVEKELEAERAKAREALAASGQTEDNGDE